MRSPLLIGLVWAATVAVAFLLGGQLKPEATARDTARPPSEHAPAPLPAPEAPPRDGAPETRIAKEPAAARSDATVAADSLPVEPVTVEPGMQPADLSSLFMRYAEKKLAEGPEGHKELFREFDRLVRDKEVRNLLRDEQQAMPLLYPWVRFLVDHDRQIIGMMETIYKTAAEDPQWFQGLDDDPLEMFAEGLALLLPGATDAEQLARFRAYAEQIVALPKESLPEALQKNLSDIQRDIEWWSPAVKPEDLAKALEDPSVPVAKKIGLLRRASPESLSGVDVTPVLAAGIREGSSQALYVVQRFQGSVSVPTLDAAFLDAVASGSQQWHQIGTYASVTGRNTWETARPFVDTGLARGGKTTEAFAQSLYLFQHLEIPKEYVANVVTSYALPDAVRTQLKKRFGIE
ncbi:MAG TPA: hypothetical protein VFY93_16680 [Planctomycetota bacterium]|nr:hypothetical protein [Planctomycetota bacterium]